MCRWSGKTTAPSNVTRRSWSNAQPNSTNRVPIASLEIHKLARGVRLCPYIQTNLRTMYFAVQSNGRSDRASYKFYLSLTLTAIKILPSRLLMMIDEEVPKLANPTWIAART